MKLLEYIKKLFEYITQHPVLQRIIQWSQTHSFPGLQRIPLYNILVFIKKELKEDAIVTRANSMAFSFFLAIFPAIIALFTLLPYTPLYNMKVKSNGHTAQFQDLLRDNITEVMPGSAGNLLFSKISEIATKPRTGLLSFGFFLAIWFASNGMVSMMRGMEKSYRSFKKRNVFQKRLIAIELTFLVGLVLVGSVVFVIMGNLIFGILLKFIKANILTQMLIYSFRWAVVIALFYTTFSTIYRFGTSVRRPILFFNAGAMLATILSLLISWGFSFYVDNFGNYNTLYGSIGALIVLMVWIQLNCMILLIGFELNAGITVLRDQRYEKELAAKKAS
ncbi:MAG: YihY/virulence factor BrkB family protein [Saprospiraceae bacterium]|nr:YihY/virulence factor BrkB family protein [Saprospiraceae bacterium]